MRAGVGGRPGIRFAAPQAEFARVGDRWLAEVREMATHGVFVGGREVNEFERRFADYLGVPAAVGVGNGTDALFLALKALGVGAGDEVITAAHTFVATAEAIHHTGARPVLVDCGVGGFLMDVEQAKASVTPRTKAIIPVHLYGQTVDLSELIPWAAKRNIPVVEDSAQAAGARMNGTMAGGAGAMGCFSFYPDKNLGAFGDGGAIAVSDPELLPLLRKLRNHGGEKRYMHDCPGFNSRLDPVQAIALGLKLNLLDEWNAHRRAAARMYESYLSGIPSMALPAWRGDQSHVFHLYVVRVDRSVREPLRKHLQKMGILTAVHYPHPVHLTPAFAGLGYGKGSFPNAEELADEIVSLPMHIELGEAEIAYIAAHIRSFLGTVHI